MIDHRKLGRELELFHSDPLVGAGLPIWLPAGAAARHAVESYVREEERRAGYQHVYSPPLAKREMYARSGHLAKFGDDMFPGIPDGEDELMLRPSICPHHAMVYASRGRSYRDLPLRVAEFGGMYRAERSGVLSGLSRVRAISLNDAHNFCALEQVGEEVRVVLGLMERVHKALGFAPHGFQLALRGDRVNEGRRGPDKPYLGDPADWDVAEGLLREALVDAGVAFAQRPGEAAFYGPKIDVQIRDSSGREWSLATVQVDFHQPVQFGLSYVDAQAHQRVPVMVHRSLVGSMERLFGHLIEVHDGAFPAWYAPVQVMVLPVSEGQADAAAVFARACVQAGLRAEASYAGSPRSARSERQRAPAASARSERSEPRSREQAQAQSRAKGSLAARIREARRVPYLAVIGAREAEAGAVSLRLRDGREQPARPAAEVLSYLAEAAAPPR